MWEGGGVDGHTRHAHHGVEDQRLLKEGGAVILSDRVQSSCGLVTGKREKKETETGRKRSEILGKPITTPASSSGR